MLRDILPPLKGVGFLIHPPDSVSSCEGYGGLDVQRRVFGRAPPYGSDIGQVGIYIFQGEPVKLARFHPTAKACGISRAPRG